MLEAQLAAAGFRVLVTNRAKSLDGVQGKVARLIADGADLSDTSRLRAALYDLAGVRIALYFPGDIGAIGSLIKKAVRARPAKTFPHNATRKYNRFPGYCATHYVGSLKNNDLKRIGADYSGEVFEIQIASVFMHAWAEVEHDLRYKPLSGELSDDELSILESLNGLALTAETQLRQLERAIDRRTRHLSDISNHYELAAMLSNLAAPHPTVSKLAMGRADVLFLFLSSLAMLDAATITRLFERTDYNEEQRSIVDGIVDMLLREDSERAALFASARQRAGENNPYEARRPSAEDTAGEVRFLRLWQLAESTLAQLVGATRDTPVRPSVLRTMADRWSTEHPEYRALSNLFGRLNYTRQLRNRFVHAGYALEQNELDREIHYLIDLIVAAAQVLEQRQREEVLRELALLPH